jgi:hypothetical protein
MRHFLFILTFNWLMTFQGLGQDEPEILTRSVVISNPDSTVQAGILVNRSGQHLENDRLYFWYSADKINCNSGGYSGYLMNGKYSVFDSDHRMIEQGEFQNGLKTGIWKRWYPDGALLRLVSWKKGLKDGSVIEYGPDGNVISRMRYRKGRLIRDRSEKSAKAGKGKKQEQEVPEAGPVPGDTEQPGIIETEAVKEK